MATQLRTKERNRGDSLIELEQMHKFLEYGEGGGGGGDFNEILYSHEKEGEKDRTSIEMQ